MSGDRAKKSVVTAFLWDGARVLLALRSNRVSTFPGHWAGISGYLEGDDAAVWALQEVREETGLAPADLVLRGVGETLDVDDAKHGGFQVHPFLIEVKTARDLEHDWEAVRFEWVDVDELVGCKRQPVVPKLYEAFQSVWPAWDDPAAKQPNLDLSLAWLRRDRSLGAGSLARAAANEWLKQVALCGPQVNESERANLTRACDELAAVRPAMVALANMMADVKGVLACDGAADDLRESVQRLIKDTEAAERRAAQRAASRVPVGATVMVNTYSSTVRNALLAASGRLERVIVCESRPLLEGRRLATDLAEAGIKVALITDAQVFSRMREVDGVLFGADAVLEDRSVVNKVGTAILALAARHFGKRITAVADTLKFARSGIRYAVHREANPTSEVWDDPPPGVRVMNEYFEAVPAELTNEIVTESEVVAVCSEKERMGE